MTPGDGAGKSLRRFPLLAVGLLAAVSCRTQAPETVPSSARREYATPFPKVWAACVEEILAADLRIQAGWLTGRGGELLARGFEGFEVTVRLAARGNEGTVLRFSFDPAHAPRATALLERIDGSLKAGVLLKGVPQGTGEGGAVLSLR